VQSRGSGNVFVDTTDAIDRKLAALLSHESQIPSVEWATEVLTMWGKVNAEFAGLPEGRTCELFRAMDGT
jgi:LmbE family N-acetylglucosaminyl deacetylase